MPLEAIDVNRRIALGAIALAGAGFALFGPRPGKERSDGRLVLDYWEKWTGVEGRAMQKVVADFNVSQSRIWVRYFATAGIDEKAQISIAGGAPPDILGLWNYNVPAFSESGAILPLDELGPKFGVRPENYAQGMRPILSHLGHFWATINTGGTLALYYNRSIFREAGLDLEKPPRTIAELDECNRRITRIESGRIARMGFHHREPGWWPFIWAYQFGGSLYDEKTDRSLAASKENIAAYEWVQSYPKEFGLDRVNDFRSGFGNYDSPLNPFLNGQLAMVIQGPWLANVIKAYAPDLDYGVAPFPVPESLYDATAPLGLVDTDILVIPRGVRHPEASMEFIAYTQRQDVVEFLSTVHCKGSPLASCSEKFLAEHPNRGIRVFDAIAKSPRAYRCPPTRTWAQMKDEFSKVLDRAWNLQGTPTALLQQAQAASQAMLDQAADARARRTGKGAA
jgi:ABC-type glycerol-3-phosphate transport system substrate-binding protein